MAKTKTKGANLPVPQSRDQAIQSVTSIGLLKRKVARLEADMNDRLARIKADYEERANPLREDITRQTEGLAIWAEANRSELTGGDKTKSVDLGSGVLRWRLRPPSVRITKVAEVIDRLRELGLTKFLRVKEEVDKDAMLKDPDVARTVTGVSIGSEGEDFIVEPFEAELASEAAA